MAIGYVVRKRGKTIKLGGEMGILVQKSVFFVFFLLGICAKNCAAKDPSAPIHLGTFGPWKAFQMTDKNGAVCFMTASPETQTGAYKKRGPVHMMITHRPDEKSYNVISFHAGYPFSDGGEIRMDVALTKGVETFSLFTKNQTAWAPDAAVDIAITRHLTRLGNSCVVHGVSAKGTKTTDTFSLSGSTAAYRAITTACRVPAKKSVL